MRRWQALLRASSSSFVADADEMVGEAANADAIIGGDDIVCDDRVLAAAKKVRWVAVIPRALRRAWARRPSRRPDLTVTNMRAVAGPVMAEHTIALMFALSRSACRCRWAGRRRAKAGTATSRVRSRRR